MTKSVTLEGLPRAGANSKPHHYKQKVQKMEKWRAFRKRFSRRNRLTISDKKTFSA